MEIIINTDKKIITVPKEFKDAYDGQMKMSKLLGKENQSLNNALDLSDYKMVVKASNIKADKTNAKTITDFMESVKDSDKDNYKEFVDMKNSKTNFFKIKKWFYEKYPEQKK